VSKFFNVGFIGAGGIARTHMNHLKKIDGVQLAAAADISEPTLKRAQEQHGIQRTYTDYRQMLKDEKDLHAISVCTPNGLHAENTIAALEAGRHVIVEKPMAMNAKEAQKMLDAARRAHKQLIIGFQYRFDPRSRMIRKQIESGQFGKILYVRCQALRRRGIPNWGVFGRKDLQGGGPMIDIGVHVLEMAHFMIGSPRPAAAFGNTWTFMGNQPSDVLSQWPHWDHKTYTVEDMAVGMIRLDGGAMLTIEASFVAHIEQDVFNVQIMGEKGGATWDPPQIYRDVDGYMMNLTPGFIGKSEVWDQKMRHFVEVCRDGRENESPGEHGLMVQKMLDGVYAAAEAGGEVPIE
jgi:predicted dehydrogenase